MIVRLPKNSVFALTKRLILETTMPRLEQRRERRFSCFHDLFLLVWLHHFRLWNRPLGAYLATSVRIRAEEGEDKGKGEENREKRAKRRKRAKRLKESEGGRRRAKEGGEGGEGGAGGEGGGGGTGGEGGGGGEGGEGGEGGF